MRQDRHRKWKREASNERGQPVERSTGKVKICVVLRIRRISDHHETNRALLDVLHIANRVVVVQPHASGRRPSEGLPDVSEGSTRRYAVPLLSSGYADGGPFGCLSADWLAWVRRREREGAVRRRREDEAMRMQAVGAGLQRFSRSGVLVAEMDDHLVPDIALDDRAGDRPHCAVVGGVWFVEVPRIH